MIYGSKAPKHLIKQAEHIDCQDQLRRLTRGHHGHEHSDVAAEPSLYISYPSKAPGISRCALASMMGQLSPGGNVSAGDTSVNAQAEQARRAITTTCDKAAEELQARVNALSSLMRNIDNDIEDALRLLQAPKEPYLQSSTPDSF
jgi:hypothetical protein